MANLFDNYCGKFELETNRGGNSYGFYIESGPCIAEILRLNSVSPISFASLLRRVSAS